MNNPRIGAFALAISCLIIAGGHQTTAQAKEYSPNGGPSTAAKCDQINTYCINDCRNGNTVPMGSSQAIRDACDRQCSRNWVKCVKTERVTGPQNRPDGTLPPKSNPGTPTKPKIPGNVTPPKSNPTPPLKPRAPGNVTAPKSNSAPSGPVLRKSGSRN